LISESANQMPKTNIAVLLFHFTSQPIDNHFNKIFFFLPKNTIPHFA